jgi:Transposase DDE domain
MSTDSFHTAALARVPLAEAALRLLDHALDTEGLANIFDVHRGAAYDRKLVFPDFVRLIADSLLGHRGASAHRTFQTLREDDEDGASVQAAYKKLSRLPTAVTLALFDHAAARLDQLAIRSQPLRDTPKSLAGFRLLAFDGKTIKFVARKLKPLRRLGGRFCGGKLLAAVDVATGRAAGVEANPDGEASDVPLVVPLIQRIRDASVDPRPRVWIGDRLYCSAAPLAAAAANGDAFIVRHHSQFRFQPDTDETTRTGTDDEGRAFTDQTGTLGRGPNALRVRHITVARAKPDGKNAKPDDLAVVTSLTDADCHPAADILAAYRLRWPIETLFQQAVQTFELRRLIGGSPHATVFQAVLALLLANITHAVRDAVADAANDDDLTPLDFSLARLFDETRRDLVGLFRMVDPDNVVAALKATPLATPATLRKHLRTLLRPLPLARYRKAPTRKGVPKPTDRGYVCGGHTSVHKALRGDITIVPIKDAKTKPCYAKKKAKDV